MKNTENLNSKTHTFRLEATKVVPIKKGDLVEVYGREWHDKVNGNSYHSVYVSINDKLVITVPFQYGYGDSYIQSATEAMIEAGYLPNPLSIMINTYCKGKSIHCVCHIQRGCKKNQLPTLKSLGL